VVAVCRGASGTPIEHPFYDTLPVDDRPNHRYRQQDQGKRLAFSRSVSRSGSSVMVCSKLRFEAFYTASSAVFQYHLDVPARCGGGPGGGELIRVILGRANRFSRAMSSGRNIP